MLSNLNSLARGLALVLAVAALAGCATSKEKLLTHGDRTMMDIWQQEAGDGGGAAGRNAGGQLLDARQSLRRPQTEADVQATPATNAAYTRTATAPCSTSGCRKPAATRAAARPRANCSMRARACAGR